MKQNGHCRIHSLHTHTEKERLSYKSRKNVVLVHGKLSSEMERM